MVGDAVLTAEVEREMTVLDARMLVAERGQSKAVVLLGILVAETGIDRCGFGILSQLGRGLRQKPR